VMVRITQNRLILSLYKNDQDKITLSNRRNKCAAL
jgi:hypothetical protein